MPYEIKTQNYSGPMDLLLQLIDQEKMEITDIALSEVTEQYLLRLEQMEEKDPEELSDFLVMAARLLLLKSRALLPAVEQELEPDDLARQLKIYKEFLEASKKINQLINLKRFTFSREKLPVEEKVEFNPPAGLKLEDLKNSFLSVLKRIEPLVQLPTRTLRKNISLKQRLFAIRDLIDKQKSCHFRHLLGDAKSKTDIIVNFLALLELLKQEYLRVKQGKTFDEIIIEKI